MSNATTGLMMMLENFHQGVIKIGANHFLLFTLLQEHSGRVFRLQFDEFQIVSSSHDDTILIWDFLNVPVPEGARSPARTYTYVTK